jgi:hypothetical protein
MEKMLHTPAQAFNDLLRARDGETNHVNHDIRFEIAHARTEPSLLVFRCAIHSHLLNGPPGAVRLIRFSLGTRDVDHFVFRRYEAWDKIGAYMTTSANHHNAHVQSPFAWSQIRI